MTNSEGYAQWSIPKVTVGLQYTKCDLLKPNQPKYVDIGRPSILACYLTGMPKGASHSPRPPRFKISNISLLDNKKNQSF